MAALTYGSCYAAFYGAGPPVEVPFLRRLAGSYDLPVDLRVLDKGCGTGRLLEPLAALGWRVVGMDPAGRERRPGSPRRGQDAGRRRDPRRRVRGPRRRRGVRHDRRRR